MTDLLADSLQLVWPSLVLPLSIELMLKVESYSPCKLLQLLLPSLDEISAVETVLDLELNGPSNNHHMNTPPTQQVFSSFE